MYEAFAGIKLLCRHLESHHTDDLVKKKPEFLSWCARNSKLVCHTCKKCLSCSTKRTHKCLNTVKLPEANLYNIHLVPKDPILAHEFNIHPCPKDGNCYYHALAQGIREHKDPEGHIIKDHKAWRKYITKYGSNNPDAVLLADKNKSQNTSIYQYIQTYENVKLYWESHSKNGVYADDTILQVTSNLLEKQIIIWRPLNENCTGNAIFVQKIFDPFGRYPGTSFPINLLLSSNHFEVLTHYSTVPDEVRLNLAYDCDDRLYTDPNFTIDVSIGAVQGDEVTAVDGIFSPQNEIVSNEKLKLYKDSQRSWASKFKKILEDINYIQVIVDDEDSKRLHEKVRELYKLTPPKTIVQSHIDNSELFDSSDSLVDNDSLPAPLLYGSKEDQVLEYTRKAIRNGDISKARRSLSFSQSPSLMSPDIRSKILSKYPDSTLPCPTVSFPTIPFQNFEDVHELLNYITSFKKGAAKSTFGFSSDDLQTLFRYEPSAAELYLGLVNKIASGMITDSLARDYILSTRGEALLKSICEDTNEISIRPIGIEDPANKVAAHLLAKRHMEDAIKICGPHQLGNKISGGTEILAHTVRMSLEENPDWVVISTDMNNAFNSISRSCIIECISKRIPGLLPYTRFTLQNESKVHYQNRRDNICLTVINKCGVSQGNLLSGLLFNVTQAKPINLIRSDHPDVVILSFHDDHFILGPAYSALKAADDLTTVLAPLGLVRSKEKSKIWSPNGYSQAFIDDAQTSGYTLIDPADGIQVVGTPIGSSTYTKKKCEDCLENIKSQMMKMKNYVTNPKGLTKADAQTIYTLTRLCLPQQLNHLLRTCPPSCTSDTARNLDVILADFIFDITQSKSFISLQSRDEIRTTIDRLFTSISCGGMGIISSSRIAEGAFLGSMCLCLSKVKQLCPTIATNAYLSETFNETTTILAAMKSYMPSALKDITGENIWDVQTLKVQQVISHALNKKVKQILLKKLPQGDAKCGYSISGNFSHNDRAIRIQGLANTDYNASAWLLANPMFPLNKMSDPAFITSFHIRMLFPVMMSRTHCFCGSEIDILGTHCYVCPVANLRNKIRNPAHKNFCDMTRKIYQTSLNKVLSINSSHEPLISTYYPLKSHNSTNTNQLSGTTDSLLEDDLVICDDVNFGKEINRRADIAIMKFDDNENSVSRNKTIIMDLTMAAPFAKKIKNYELGAAAEEAEKTKLARYHKYFDISNPKSPCELIIFAAEVTGVLGKTAKNHIKCVTKGASVNQNLLIQYMYQTLSIEIQSIRADQIINYRKKFSLDEAPEFPLSNNINKKAIWPTPSPYLSKSKTYNHTILCTPSNYQNLFDIYDAVEDINGVQFTFNDLHLNAQVINDLVTVENSQNFSTLTNNLTTLVA